MTAPDRDPVVAALIEIAHNTSTSVPMGSWPVHRHADNVRRCIGIAANALPLARTQAALEGHLEEMVECAITDSDTCSYCLQDTNRHASGCPVPKAAAALADYRRALEAM